MVGKHGLDNLELFRDMAVSLDAVVLHKDAVLTLAAVLLAD